jgi:hypothetical protein
VYRSLLTGPLLTDRATALPIREAELEKGMN